VRRKLSKILKVDLSPRHDERIGELREINGSLPFHERYVSGDFVGVWKDLVALSHEVRYDPIAADALAVAYETMHRAAANIEILVTRLQALGYKFRNDVFARYWRTSLADAATREVLEGRLEEFAEAARATGPPTDLPPNLIAWCEQNLVNIEAKVRAARELRMGLVRPHLPRDPAIEFPIKRVVRAAGEIPLSLRAWYHTVGAVNLVGHHPELAPSDVDCDPLFVAPFRFVLDACLAWDEEHADEDERPPFRLPISPHRIAKVHCTSSVPLYTALLPNAGADTEIDNEPHGRRFVEYLRVCFEWGGFPGYADSSLPVPALLARLKDGLLPL
jgi:hypothetical protein